MGGHLGSLLALQRGHAAGEGAGCGGKHVVGDDVGALGQVVDEQVGGAVAGLAIHADALLVAVAAHLVDGLEARGALVGDLDIVHGLVAGDDEPHAHLVADLDGG